VDASQGVLTQTRRHSFICSLLGIKHVALAVNKMDLVNFNRETYDGIVGDYRTFSEQLDFETITPIPMSALEGDNVIERSAKAAWYSGPTLIGFLETVEAHQSKIESQFRMPVQWVNRPNRTFRGFSGTVVSGIVKRGEEVRVLPSGETAQVEDIVLYKGSLPQAITDQAVTLKLSKEVDCSRGDVIVAAKEPIEVADQFEANIVWMDQEAGHHGRSYWLKTSTTRVNATISDIKFKYNINTLEHLSSKEMELNDIGVATISVDRGIPFEPYSNNRSLGSFVLIDRYTNATVAAGMINFALRRAQNIHAQKLVVDRSARETLNGHKARVLWFTGLSGSGKSSIADALEQRLHKRGIRTYILDGDNVRHGLNQDLGFDDADRVENIRRVAEVAKLLTDAGIVVLTSFISPFKAERDMARRLFEDGEFLEIHVDTPIEEAEKRDVKGLYAKARRGELPNFTGVDSPYEAPEKPEIHLYSSKDSIDTCVQQVVDYLGGESVLNYLK
jgi:bifunctional enzyme CysN/CysC